MRGNSLTNRLNKLTSMPGMQTRLTNLIGQDGVDNLYRVADLLSKPETAIKTENAAKEVARHLTGRIGRGALVGGTIGGVLGHMFGPVGGYIGASAGGSAGAFAADGGQWVLRQAAINPRVGMLLDRAVRHNVDPKIFGDLIAGAISSQNSQTSQEEQPQ
jgi:hypothetical protein